MDGSMFIGGNWVAGSATIPVTNPASEETIAEVAVASDEQVHMAVQAALQCGEGRRGLPGICGSRSSTGRWLPPQARLMPLAPFEIPLSFPKQSTYPDV